jgi:hypothetical protein
MKDVLKKILIGVGIITVVGVFSLAITAHIDNRIEEKTTTPIEKLTIKVDSVNYKVDDMSDNINSIMYVICKDSLVNAEVENLKENKIIK